MAKSPKKPEKIETKRDGWDRFQRTMDTIAPPKQPTSKLEAAAHVLADRMINGAAPGTEQSINRMLDDFERTFGEHDVHKIIAGLRCNGLNVRLKAAQNLPPLPYSTLA